MTADERLLAWAMEHASAPAEAWRPVRDRIWRRVGQSGWKASGALRETAPALAATEHELMHAFDAGDGSAFDVLIERHLGALVGYARRSLDSAAADDAVQEAALVLFIKRANVGPDVSIRGFLFRALRYEIKKELRRRLRQTVPLDDDHADGAESQLDGLVRHEDRERVLQALARACNPLEQDAALLILEERTGAEIAETLDLQPGHVRVLKHRLLRKLQAELKGAGE